MVKKIYVHEGKKVDIQFRFANEMEKLGMLSQMAGAYAPEQGVV